MSAYPQDGSTFVTETIVRTAYRWAKYKPDGARQMGKPGRWQKQVWSGDWFKWGNCEDPEGEISPPIEDGPISKAFKEQAASLQRIAELESDNAKAFDALKGLVRLIDAVKYQVGLGNDQLKRLDSAKALLDARAALQGGGNG